MNGPLSIVEASYGGAPSEHAWLQAIADAALPVLDAGLGVVAYTVDLDEGLGVRIRGAASAGVSALTKEHLAQYAVQCSAEDARRLYAPCPPVAFASEVQRRTPHVESAKFASHIYGRIVEDSLAIRGIDPDGHGCIVSAPLAGPGSLSPRRRAVLGRVAAHLASAFRLRRSVAVAHDGEPEAVISPRGSLEHLSPEVRGRREARSLLHAVLSRERALSDRIAEPDALELWKALVDGRWSLIDQVDRDGKRYILARRNAPDVQEPTALSLRERQVVGYASQGHSNKHIAYQLGMAPTTVATHLATALRKLKIRTRRELIREL